MRYRPVRPDTWLKVIRQGAFVQQNCRCHYCRSKMTVKEVTADHKLPRSKGGRDSRENIAASCSACNNAKGSMTEKQFIRAIHQPPTGSTPFPVQLAWMRRKINLRAERVKLL